MSYKEMRRDWPDEAQQPECKFEVLNPANQKGLKDKKRCGYLMSAFLSLKADFFHF